MTSTITHPPAVVLLSGGMDSATVLAIAMHEGFTPHALSFRYGQRHNHELQAAAAVAKRAGVTHHVIADIDLRIFGGSALTADIPVPKQNDPSTASPTINDNIKEPNIPITYVPARNTIFLSFALAMAETLGCSDIFLGVNAIDYSGYPDCRPQYIQAFEQMARLATKAGVNGKPLHIHAPLIHLSKAQIIKRGVELGVDFAMTSSCYDPDPRGRACGQCDACLLRLRGFVECGLSDPAEYVNV